MNIYTGKDCLRSEELKIAITKSDFDKDLIKIVSTLNSYKLNYNLNLSFHIYCKYSGLLPINITVFNLDPYNPNILNESRVNSGYLIGGDFSFQRMLYAVWIIKICFFKILSLIDTINQKIEIKEWNRFKFKNYDYKNKTWLFINIPYPLFSDPYSDPEIKIINPCMRIYKCVKEAKISKTSEFKLSFKNLSGVHTKALLPSKPNVRYPIVQAIVIKDRNPIGKFKSIPAAKGIVTIFITVEGIFHEHLHN